MTNFSWPSRITAEVVTRAGWSPERKIDIQPWLDDLGSQGFSFSQYAIDVLTSFGGLRIPPQKIEGALYAGTEIEFDPMEVGDGMRERYVNIESRLGQRLSPLADCGGESSLLIAENGSILQDWSGGIRLLGETFPDALDLAIRRHKWPVSVVEFDKDEG
ncbi:SUKH-3 domain-containing protein [Nocardia cyriacigeorgica]|uniref:SUKH-3 domain-containing protein n=1 Tax=Nocardia cyriacigeorgica TaxID=135487 RepID=UPI001894EA79|nr:SUKH-3 domain-containing protein [Nocardia cyriacigeorgica]MBF6289850.1 SUKH-3 domain-containing protein [Nocardia cyriacigeorgica]